MKIKLIIIILLFSYPIFAQKIDTNNLSQDELNFIKYNMDEDTLRFNKFNKDSIRIGYWLIFDSLNQVSLILYYSPSKTEYDDIGTITDAFKRSIVYNNTKYKVDMIYDNIYKNIFKINKDAKNYKPIEKINPFESIEEIKIYCDTSLFFKINDYQIIRIVGDTAMILNDVCTNKKKYHTTNSDNFDITQSGIMCSCTNYHNVNVTINKETIHFINLFEVQYFDINNLIYIFSYQNCAKRLRIYRIKKD